MNWQAWIWSSVCVLGLTACAATPVTPQSSAQAAIQGRFDAGAEQWLLTLAEWQAQPGAELAAELRRQQAELADLAEQCIAASQCDAARIVARYRQLLDVQVSATLEAAVPAEVGVEGEGVEAEPASAAVEPVVADAAPLGALDAAVTQLKGRDLRELIAMNEPVRAALNEWLTWMRPQLMEAHENYQFMRPQMWPEYEQAGLPEALLFGILAKESAGKVHAVSRAGAAGPLQFMPSTGARFGLGRDGKGFDTRFDPRLSTRANVRYLNERFAEFNNDLALALAAYNGGEGRVQRLYRSSAHKSFWDAALNKRLPRETRDYVPMVLAAAWLFLHPEDYGLEFNQVDTAIADLTLQAPTSLNQLAVCLGQTGTRSGWFRALRNLNPRQLPHIELAAGSQLAVPLPVVQAYADHCLAGERASMARAVAQAAIRHPDSVAKATGQAYRVRSGDTLASIARRHGCRSPQALAAANGIKPPRYLIKPGQTLRLHDCSG